MRLVTRVICTQKPLCTLRHTFACRETSASLAEVQRRPSTGENGCKILPEDSDERTGGSERERRDERREEKVHGSFLSFALPLDSTPESLDMQAASERTPSLSLSSLRLLLQLQWQGSGGTDEESRGDLGMQSPASLVPPDIQVTDSIRCLTSRILLSLSLSLPPLQQQPPPSLLLLPSLANLSPSLPFLSLSSSSEFEARKENRKEAAATQSLVSVCCCSGCRSPCSQDIILFCFLH